MATAGGQERRKSVFSLPGVQERADRKEERAGLVCPGMGLWLSFTRLIFGTAVWQRCLLRAAFTYLAVLPLSAVNFRRTRDEE